MRVEQLTVVDSYWSTSFELPLDVLSLLRGRWKRSPLLYSYIHYSDYRPLNYYISSYSNEYRGDEMQPSICPFITHLALKVKEFSVRTMDSNNLAIWPRYLKDAFYSSDRIDTKTTGQNL